MPAIDSFHMRARLVSDLGTRIGQKLISGWLQAETQPVAIASTLYQRYLQEANAGWIAEQIKVAESFYVTDDMMTLTEHAAASMPDQWIEREDVPAEAGFLWLPRPITSYDIRGRRLKTRALSWHPYHGALAVTHWTDRDGLDDDINAQLKKMWTEDPRDGIAWDQFPKLQLQHVMPDRWGGGLPVVPNGENMHRWRELLDVAFVPQYDDTGITWDVDPEIGTEENRVHAHRLLYMNPPVEIPDPCAAFLATFCRLCQQSITIAEKEPVDRTSRRRTKNLPNNESVTVINLRHAKAHRQEDESQVEWSHRWLRRGHWRRQWYGSGEDKHQAPIYINQAICGPEDKPLVIREHVTSLSR